MGAALNYILSITALILIGCFCGFFVLLNYIKERIEREDNDKTKDKTI